MASYELRAIRSEDFEALKQLETDVFGAAGYALLCPHYLRVCTEMYADTCFIAIADDKPIGYILCFIRRSEAYSTRVGVLKEYQGTGAAVGLIAKMIGALVEADFERLWFTVKPDNAHARDLYRRIGATEIDTRKGFLSPGDELIIGEMLKPAMEAFCRKYVAAH